MALCLGWVWVAVLADSVFYAAVPGHNATAGGFFKLHKFLKDSTSSGSLEDGHVSQRGVVVVWLNRHAHRSADES